MGSVQDLIMGGFSLSTLLTSSGGQYTPVKGGDNGTDIFGIIDLINKHEGGYFNPKQGLRLEDPKDPNSRWMIFAKENMDEDEILATIPWSLMIKPTDNNEQGVSDLNIDGDSVHCQTVRNLASEFESGEKSNVAEFVQYLNALPPSQIPSSWSNAGKDVLVEILGGIEQELPPRAPVHALQEWYEECDGDSEDETAATFVAQRGLYKAFMVPTFDWYTHRNGHYYNIQTELVDTKHFQIKARRAIMAGEPIHNSYDRCDDCDQHTDEDGYGTPELFRDFGIVEDYPQRWSYKPRAVEIQYENGDMSLYVPELISFDLLEDDDNEFIHVQWDKHIIMDDRGRNYIRRLFRKELRRLYRLQNIHFEFIDEVDEVDNSTGDMDANSDENNDENTVLTPREWKMVQSYYRALRSALQVAIHSLENEGDGTAQSCQPDESSNEGACESAHVDVYGVHYDDLKFEEDDVDYIFPGCSKTQLVEFYTYEMLEDFNTNYQRLWFMDRESDGDVCMNLETTLQICSNYRPHYHEFFVHFPARFLDKIERVIWIGGGDAMLLHEILKYPSLKKVVGLELDQQVTRKSFQYFKSQPHWDNEKVEWWYGDATKSLPLLPRDYWGSFDLVLVDLSETVMSFSVTQTMDIFSALSLLLKPDGIMVKNEPYIDQFSKFFDYSIHIFYGTPKICTQVMVMGSNNVDFLHHPTKDHGMERLLLESLDDDVALHFKYMHDYRKSDAREQGKCKDNDYGTVTIEHGRKSGLMEILEADNTSFDFENESLEQLIYSIVKELGLVAQSLPMVKAELDGPVTVVMAEGYIVARAAPEHRHISFDVNLWGSFSKLESLRNALLDAVGSRPSSSFYRVVVGGMHGTSTWEDDKDTIGIQISQQRNCKPSESKDTDAPESEVAKVALTEALQKIPVFLPEKKVLAAVLCGFEGQGDECTSANILSEGDNVLVAPLWACPSLAEHTPDSFDFDEAYACEQQLIQRLHAFVQKVGRDIDMLVIDASAPFVMAQIFHSVWAMMGNREAFLSDKHLLLTFTNLNKPEEAWRKHIVERYRKENHFFPLSRAEVTMAAGPHKFELNLLAVDDPAYFDHLRSLESDLQASLPQFTIEAKTITGGMLYYNNEYDSREFEPEAYDPAPATAQAAEQVALGRQGIFQFELTTKNDDSDDDENSIKLLGNTDKKTGTKLEDLGTHLSESLKKIGVDSSMIKMWETYSNAKIGMGGVIVTSFQGGNALLVWDGKDHIDINLFTTNQSKENADTFVNEFAEMASLTKTLRDDQPRGPGRPVLFEHETMYERKNKKEGSATKVLDLVEETLA